MKITVVGIGYVGIANALILSKLNEVKCFDIDSKKVDLINNKEIPILDKDASHFIENKNLNIKGVSSKKEAYKDAELVIISTPTNYDENKDFFDTSSIEGVLEDAIKINSNAIFLIKSTIPIGYVDSIRKKYKNIKIIFSPEFLREGFALHDSLYPSRIIFGSKSLEAASIATLYQDASESKDIPILFTSSKEAEAVKLFSNTYLALRVAFFNELDSFSIINGINIKEVIQGMGFDSRIGDHYNNPSFGYGGYCLPKDTKQLKSNFKDTPEKIITAIIDSNETRKSFIAELVKLKNPKLIGVYRLTMKSGSDNFRSSAIHDVLSILKRDDYKILIYEPLLIDNVYEGMDFTADLDFFKKESDLILANRLSDDLKSVEDKIFTRDVFLNN